MEKNKVANTLRVIGIAEVVCGIILGLIILVRDENFG